MSKAYWHIRNCSLFQQLTEDEISALETHAKVKKFAKGESIYKPTDAADGTFLLAEGRIRLCSLTPDGRQSILGFVEPGELFGELGLVDPGYREERAVAVVPSVVTYIPNQALWDLMEKSPDLTVGVTKLIGMRRRRIERRLRGLLFRTNRDRLKSLLVELAEQYGAPSADGVELTIRLSHLDLANIIGATRETVTNLLGEMQERGELLVKRQRLIIHDVRRMAESVRPADHPAMEPPKPSLKASSSSH
ncbi:MAG: transcriptional regulator [Pirellulaceae bacterium]|nr:MAG: transcriptional regulator [Pirellulaceae bacterium]